MGIGTFHVAGMGQRRSPRSRSTGQTGRLHSYRIILDRTVCSRAAAMTTRPRWPRIFCKGVSTGSGGGRGHRITAMRACYLEPCRLPNRSRSTPGVAWHGDSLDGKNNLVVPDGRDAGGPGRFLRRSVCREKRRRSSQLSSSRRTTATASALATRTPNPLRAPHSRTDHWRRSKDKRCSRLCLTPQRRSKKFAPEAAVVVLESGRRPFRHPA